MQAWPRSELKVNGDMMMMMMMMVMMTMVMMVMVMMIIMMILKTEAESLLLQ